MTQTNHLAKAGQKNIQAQKSIFYVKESILPVIESILLTKNNFSIFGTQKAL